MNQTNSWSPLSVLGLIIVLGWLFFKLPGWLEKPEAPEIYINDSLFEAKPETSVDGTMTVELKNFYDFHIRIRPEKAVIKKAELKVTVNGQEVEPNCGNDTYWCYYIDNTDIPENTVTTYNITATNKKGTAKKTVNVKNTKEAKNDTDASESLENTEQNQNIYQPVTNNWTDGSSCWHYEAGRCWDDLEGEAEANGRYDYNYGYYGASDIYPDDCDQRCQDIYEDAYDQGYYYYNY